jgi:hypothetical protein
MRQRTRTRQRLERARLARGTQPIDGVPEFVDKEITQPMNNATLTRLLDEAYAPRERES